MSTLEEVSVLIVGGGGAGLTASMLLSKLGVDSLLVSALPSTSVLPKAHLLNQRTMEILADAGIAEEVYEHGTPRRNMSHTAFYAGFAGWPDAGRLLGKLEAWGGGGADLDWEAASPKAAANLPQIRLEPIMRRHAESLAPGMVRFGHELVDFTQDAHGVTATVVDHATDRSSTVRARYLFACDGGRMIGPKLGVEQVGLREVGRVATTHFSADLSAWASDPEVLIRWIWLPHLAKLATLVPMGPTRWGPDSEEWVCHLNYDAQDPRLASDADVEEDLRRALGIADHPLEIHLITRWELMGVVASSLQVGRTFLLGDAAHRHPPTGGLGLTSATQDVHNLCWKVALVLRGIAGEELLTTYEPERRTSVQRNVDNSLDSALNHVMIGTALGLAEPDLSPEAGWQQVARLWSDQPADAPYRRQVRQAIAAQTMEFRKLNVEYGYCYDSAAILDDGSDPVPPIDPVRIYQPSTRPGSPLPHVWVEGADGQRRSTLDLVEMGKFLLITAEHGEPWSAAAGALAAQGLPIVAVSIGQQDGDYLDLQSQWRGVRGIADDGALLVRPDRFVAWRCASAVIDPEATLAAAMDQILSRSAS